MPMEKARKSLKKAICVQAVRNSKARDRTSKPQKTLGEGTR
uniref:Uncharacterized protein n=1 Tax=Anguilla anguilla TaxID=7936 RepID=A0A0E9VD70_ANGAN